MRVLYVASDIALSANHGGAVHVREVAGGLADLGHTVRAVVKGRAGEPARSIENGFDVCRVFALRRRDSFVSRACRRRPRSRVSFAPTRSSSATTTSAAKASSAAMRHGIPVVLEVNSPLVEYRGSPKERLDRLLGSPLRRWREHLARSAAAFVTPSAAIIPDFVPRREGSRDPLGREHGALSTGRASGARAAGGGPPRRRVRRQLSALARRPHRWSKPPWSFGARTCRCRCS